MPGVEDELLLWMIPVDELEVSEDEWLWLLSVLAFNGTLAKEARC